MLCTLYYTQSIHLSSIFQKLFDGLYLCIIAEDKNTRIVKHLFFD